MTEQEAVVIFQQALKDLDSYIATQMTKDQILDAKHRKNHLVINEGYFIGNLILDKPYHLCKHCGAIEFASFCEPTKTQLQVNRVCFHCNHWEQIAKVKDLKLLVIDGRTYRNGGASAGRKDFLGFGGHLWTIKQGDHIWTTNNLWSGGTVPYEFRDRLPDNAVFIKEGD